MDFSLFKKISAHREQIKKDKQQAKRAHESQVREHEFAHARVAGPYVDEIKFFYRKDANNIEHVEHGAVFLNTKLVQSKQANIEKLTRLIQASEAPAGMSQQDRKLKAFLESQLSRMRQAK